MSSLITALAKAARRWYDPDPQKFRTDAVKATLEAPNQFTEQAVAFAIGQQMSEVTESALSDWIRGRTPVQSHKIGGNQCRECAICRAARSLGSSSLRALIYRCTVQKVPLPPACICGKYTG